MKFNTVIVGGGISGLLVGAILSKKGQKVLILEKNPIIGGRANSIEYKKGYIVDWGIHLIRYSNKSTLAKQIFKKQLGEKLDIINCGDIKLFQDGAFHDFPLSIRGLASTDIFNEQEKKAFGPVLVDILNLKVENYLDMPVPDFIKELEEKHGSFSPSIRDFLVVVANLMCVSTKTDYLSTGEFVDGIKTGAKAPSGTSYPRGGWKAILDRLVEIINENGEVRTKTKVDSVKIENNSVKGVIIDGELIEAETVVLAIPVKNIFSLIPESTFSQEFIKRAKSIIPTGGVWIDFGLKENIFDHNGTILTKDPFTMSFFASNLDPKVAPEGEQLYTIFQPTEVEIFQDKEKAKQVEENLMKLLNEMYPNFSEKVIWHRTSVGIADGAAPFITQHRNKRPSVKSDIQGLYFTGDSYGAPGTGGEISHTSAYLCAKAILTDKGIE
ncbi:MAG: phytoene desaturase family protein [Candidatus Helarchaeota archaeon]